MKPSCAVVVLLLLTGCGGDHGARVNSLTVSDTWARPTPTGAVNGVVYLTVASPVDDAVVAAEVPPTVAARAELHETMGSVGSSPMANMPEMAGGSGEMTMVAVDRVPVAAGGTVAFQPGGKHIMLADLTAPLVAGQRFTLTLHFASGATLAVEVPVSANPPGG